MEVFSVNDKPKTMTAVDWLSLFLFFCGVALIAAGLWLYSRPLALIYIGIMCIYVGRCVFNAANSPERTDKK